MTMSGFLAYVIYLKLSKSRVLITQDYWGDIKEDWGLGDGSPPARSMGIAPVEGLGDEVPQKLKFFLWNYT